jgi:hypothetical protein
MCCDCAVAGLSVWRDTSYVETGAARAGRDVNGRFLAIDEQGIGLRATWRPAHGFVNVSLWRDDQCVETFHLTPHQLSALVSFLVSRLATLAPEHGAPALALVDPVAGISRRKVGLITTVRRAVVGARTNLAAVLKKAAAHIEP